LANATSNRKGEFIFDVSASRDIKSPKMQRHLRILRLMLAGLQRQGALLADDAKRKRVIENLRVIQKLMRGAPERNELRRPAWLVLLHIDSLS